MRIDDMRRDVRSGLRGLARTPGFTAAALVTLALGIGATSAIFTVVESVLLAPLPYAQPERRVMLWSRWVAFDKTWLSDQEVLDYRRLATTLTGVAAWSTGQQNLTGDGEPQRVGVGSVTANTFEVLGARPALGRTISAEDDRPNAAPVAVLSDSLWRARYGADPAILGRRLLIDDVSVEVIGVMPPGFRLPTDFTVEAAEPTELWRALQIDERNAERGSHGNYAAAVLAPGHTVASASDELRALTAAMTDQGLYPEPMRFSAFATAIDDEIRGDVRPALALLLGAALCLLLIACANVANLLLVRGEARMREVAVRAAIGASGERLVRQFVTEAVVLATGGAIAGLALAVGALQLLATVDPTSLPSLAPVRPDALVVGVTLLLAVGTTLACGAWPARRALRVNLVDALREGSQQATVGGARLRLRGAFVVAEVALAVVLVIGAGLMVRSLGALGRVPLGFSPDGVLTLRMALPRAGYGTPERVVAAYQRLLEDVRALPGVASAGVVRALPLATTIGDWGMMVDGYTPPPGTNAKGDWQIVSDGAFEAMGMRLVRGRWFTSADTTASQPVAVVNETLARTYFADGEAVGRRVRFRNGGDFPWAVIVGIVADERHNGVTVASKEKFYVPHSQWHVLTENAIRNAFLVVRTGDDPRALAGPLRAAVRRLDPNVPIANVRPMTEVVAAALATPRLTGFVLGAFAVAALVLAIVGLYGVLSYLVARRAHEIGIRMALGAERGQVLSMIVRYGLTLAALGLVVGLAGAFGATRLMRGLLYAVQPTDPITFVVVPVVLLAVAVVASLVPALRAMRVSPMVALRTE